jgi:hypothetical protein
LISLGNEVNKRVSIFDMPQKDTLKCKGQNNEENRYLKSTRDTKKETYLFIFFFYNLNPKLLGRKSLSNPLPTPKKRLHPKLLKNKIPSSPLNKKK